MSSKTTVLLLVAGPILSAMSARVEDDDLLGDLSTNEDWLAKPTQATPRSHSGEDQLEEHSFAEVDARSSAHANLSHAHWRSGFDSNEHKYMADAAFKEFIHSFEATILAWVQSEVRADATPDFYIGIDGVAPTEDAKKISTIRDFANFLTYYGTTLEEGHKDNEGSLSFGDFVYLSGDFVTGDKNYPGKSDHWPYVQGTYAQKDADDSWAYIHHMYPEKNGLPDPPWKDAKDTWRNLIRRKLQPKWLRDVGLPMLNRYVGGLAAKGESYKGGEGAAWAERQAKFMGFTMGYYGLLLKDNINHFSQVARYEYMQHHRRAMDLAYNAGASSDEKGVMDMDVMRKAVEIEAVGQHFLTDLFAAGHARTPRAELSKLCGVRGDGMSGFMHNEDGRIGIIQEFDQAPAPEYPDDGSYWTSYGDATFFRTPGVSEVPTRKIEIAIKSGLRAVYHSFLQGLIRAPKKEMMPPMPRPLPMKRQPFPPMFLATPPQAPPVVDGEEVSVFMRTTAFHMDQTTRDDMAMRRTDFLQDQGSYKIVTDQCDSLRAGQGVVHVENAMWMGGPTFDCMSCSEALSTAQAYEAGAREADKSGLIIVGDQYEPVG